MAKVPSKTGRLSATLWALLFAACLGLVVAHLVTTARTEIESTFSRARNDSHEPPAFPGHGSPRLV